MNKNIEELADAVRKMYPYEVPVKSIADFIGVFDIKLEIDKDTAIVSGYLEKYVIEKRGKSCIFHIDKEYTVNEVYTHLHEAEFRVAQLLAYTILKLGLPSEEQWSKVGYGFHAIEGSYEDMQNVNELALALLMPSDQYKKVLRSCADIGELAEHFGVSVSKACMRGRSLGLLKSPL